MSDEPVPSIITNQASETPVLSPCSAVLHISSKDSLRELIAYWKSLTESVKKSTIATLIERRDEAKTRIQSAKNSTDKLTNEHQNVVKSVNEVTIQDSEKVNCSANGVVVEQGESETKLNLSKNTQLPIQTENLSAESDRMSGYIVENFQISNSPLLELLASLALEPHPATESIYKKYEGFPHLCKQTTAVQTRTAPEPKKRALKKMPPKKKIQDSYTKTMEANRKYAGLGTNLENRISRLTSLVMKSSGGSSSSGKKKNISQNIIREKSGKNVRKNNEVQNTEICNGAILKLTKQPTNYYLNLRLTKDKTTKEVKRTTGQRSGRASTQENKISNTRTILATPTTEHTEIVQAYLPLDTDSSGTTSTLNIPISQQHREMNSSQSNYFIPTFWSQNHQTTSQWSESTECKPTFVRTNTSFSLPPWVPLTAFTCTPERDFSAVNFQVCNESMSYPPITKKLSNRGRVWKRSVTSRPHPTNHFESPIKPFFVGRNFF